MRFWDTSAVVPLVIEQPQTGVAEQLAEEDPVIAVWWGTLVECHSAFTRLRREGVLDTNGEVEAMSSVHTLRSRWTEIEPSEEVRRVASDLLRRHPLRAAEALQLGAALVWAEIRPTGHILVSMDNRLRRAASDEGFQVLPAALS